MKRTQRLGFTLLLLLPGTVVAQSPFDGTWKLDSDTAQIQAKPEIYSLKNGKYVCSACDPPLHLKADGNDKKITGDACFDTVNVRVIDDRTVEETYKKNGATVQTSRMTVSFDGQTATMDWSERCNAKGDLVTIRRIMTRVAQGPPGAHSVSGSWRLIKRVGASNNALTAILKLEGGTFSFMDPAGQGYIAKLDGTETPTCGELGNNTVSVRRLAKNTIKETHKENGKVTEIVTYVLANDGKSMTITIEHTVAGNTSKYTATKQ
jgi:hypothetical protein